MNPDEYQTKVSCCISKWTLTKDGLVYVFRRYTSSDKTIEICEPDGNIINVAVESARAVWETLINNGFVIKKEEPPVPKKKQIRRQDSRKMKWAEAVRMTLQEKERHDRFEKAIEMVDKTFGKKNYAMEA